MKNIIVLASLIFIATGVLAQVTHNNGVSTPPEIVVNTTPKPAAPAKSYQKVAALTIAFEFDKGKVQDARLLKSKRISSAAPKVFVRQGGDWEVVLTGAKEHRFYVNNPGYSEAEPHRSSNNRYQWVAETGRIEWPLIIPLYKDGKAIDVNRVIIRDRQSGERIFEARI